MVRKAIVLLDNEQFGELPPNDTLGGVPSTSVLTSQDAAINGLLVASDRLIDLNMDSQVNLDTQKPYFCQVVAAHSVTVGGMLFRMRYGGYQTDNNFNNAVGLYDINGNRLAVGNAGPAYRGGSNWNRIPFTASYSVVAGTRYVLGIMVDGNSPGFTAANGHSEINALIAAGGLLRSFRKSSVANFADNFIDFTTNITANTDARIFLSLVA